MSHVKGKMRIKNIWLASKNMDVNEHFTITC